jgi:hypothetical protein
MWIQYFACFYLTIQLELIPPEFWLAGVVLVVSKPHVFNLTGQLESKPPEFSTLAVTALLLLPPHPPWSAFGLEVQEICNT